MIWTSNVHVYKIKYVIGIKSVVIGLSPLFFRKMTNVTRLHVINFI